MRFLSGCSSLAVLLCACPPSTTAPERPSAPARAAAEVPLDVGPIAHGPLGVTLACVRGEFAAPRDVWFAGWVDVPGDAVVVRDSAMVVTTRDGGVAARLPKAFQLAPGERTRGFSSSAGPILPSDLPDGEYRAVWSVNGVASNVVTFRLDPSFTIARAPALKILPLEWEDGRRDSTSVLVQRTNGTSTTMNLLAGDQGSVLLVDDTPRPHDGLLLWAGSSTLTPGYSWAMVASFDRYGVGLSPGVHHLALRMGGDVSNTLTVRVR